VISGSDLPVLMISATMIGLLVAPVAPSARLRLTSTGSTESSHSLVPHAISDSNGVVMGLPPCFFKTLPTIDTCPSLVILALLTQRFSVCRIPGKLGKLATTAPSVFQFSVTKRMSFFQDMTHLECSLHSPR